MQVWHQVDWPKLLIIRSDLPEARAVAFAGPAVLGHTADGLTESSLPQQQGHLMDLAPHLKPDLTKETPTR